MRAARNDAAIVGLGALLIRLLRQLDAESTTVINGVETGLAAYNWHRGTHSEELAWAARLRELLDAEGYRTHGECPYPGQELKKGKKKCCDIVIEMPDDSRVWLEIKAAWKKYFSSRDGLQTNERNYGPYLFGGSKSHSAAGDLKKLEVVSNRDASHVAFLLIGFDAADSPMDADVGNMIRAEQLDRRGWRSMPSTPWSDRRCASCRIYPWFWWRPADSEPEPATRREKKGDAMRRDPLTLDDAVRVSHVLPDSHRFQQQGLSAHMLELLGITGSRAASAQSAIKSALGSANTAAFLYGPRGEEGFPPYTTRRKDACVRIVQVVTNL